MRRHYPGSVLLPYFIYGDGSTAPRTGGSFRPLLVALATLSLDDLRQKWAYKQLALLPNVEPDAALQRGSTQ